MDLAFFNCSTIAESRNWNTSAATKGAVFSVKEKIGLENVR